MNTTNQMILRHRSFERGFSLIEISIGLVLLTFAVAALIKSSAAGNEQRNIAITNAILVSAKDSLNAFVVTNGRLPCPATTTSNGQESIASNSGGIIACTVESGFLPAVSLGIAELDSFGFKNDAWSDGPSANGPRALRYAVTNLSGTVLNALTSPGLGALGSTTRRLDVQTAITSAQQGLFVCQSAVGISASGNRCGSAANTISNNAAFAIWSRGGNARDVSNFSPDETQNSNQPISRVIIFRSYAPAGASNGSFDDLAIWVPYSVVADRLFSTGFVQ